MALPIVKQPIYEMKLLGNGKTVVYRGFTHKEEKIILQAKEENEESKYLVVSQIINNCTFGKVSVEELSPFDMEMLFIKIRSKSVGEIIALGYRCKNKVDDNTCDNEFITKINLNDVEIKGNVASDADKKVMINEELGIMLKYPGLKEIEQAKTGDEELMCFIDFVFDSEQTYRLEDSDESEVVAFLDSIPSTVKEKIKKFASKIPTVGMDVKTTCDKCGNESNVELRGMNDFFM